MRVPSAPSWHVVFGFGVLWNALVGRSLFGTTVCLGIWAFYLIWKRLLEPWMFPTTRANCENAKDNE